MSSRYMYAGVGALLLTFACGSKVEIGHGNEGGEGNVAGSGGNAGSEAQSGAPSEGGTGGSVIGGTAGSTSSGGSYVGGPIPSDIGPQREVTKVDLLVAVDNSLSMADKQRLFAKAVPELVQRLVNPPCVNGAGTLMSQPASPDDACPSGQRATEPLRDLHIGVITSSLGSHGASGANSVCTHATDDDHAHLLPTVRNELDSYNDKGYLKWDPDGKANPPGESDADALADALGEMVEAAGETGCGYEAQLESVYRFLVDPEPPQAVTVPSGSALAEKQGVDNDLLSQRAAFLRPDSSVVVLMLTDENDCSAVDEGYGWLVARNAPQVTMFRSTSQCAQDPNDACCQSCGESTANPGCPEITADSECVKGKTVDAEDDNLNLRCFEQKRRFGFDLLYPTQRYVSGFGGGTVPDRNSQLVENPLFHRDGVDRDPSLFTFAVIGGMPWQDVVLSRDSVEPTVMTASQLENEGRWPLLIGDVDQNVPPTDPFMRESTSPRSGQNPITLDRIEPSSSTDPDANSINGHEQVDLGNDLQYACTYELPAPVECNTDALSAGVGCDCFADELANNRSVCNPPDGGAATTTQYYGKAYPALRELRVARELGRRTVLGSVCSRNTQDDTRADYGYRPVFTAIGRRIAETLTKP